MLVNGRKQVQQVVARIATEMDHAGNCTASIGPTCVKIVKNGQWNAKHCGNGQAAAISGRGFPAPLRKF